VLPRLDTIIRGDHRLDLSGEPLGERRNVPNVLQHAPKHSNVGFKRAKVWKGPHVEVAHDRSWSSIDQVARDIDAACRQTMLKLSLTCAEFERP
jgi:hypothetical protein